MHCSVVVYRHFLFTSRHAFLVYLYGEAATDERRKTVPQIRSGEYEGLADKVKVIIAAFKQLSDLYMVQFL